MKPDNKNKALTKLLETSRILYLFAVAGLFLFNPVIFSVYPPFYQGTHSTVLAWITFFVLLLMHIFCFVDKKIKDRSVWSFMYFLYHICLVVWFLLAMGFAYNWSAKQWDINKQKHQINSFITLSFLLCKIIGSIVKLKKVVVSSLWKRTSSKVKMIKSKNIKKKIVLLSLEMFQYVVIFSLGPCLNNEEPNLLLRDEFCIFWKGLSLGSDMPEEFGLQ